MQWCNDLPALLRAMPPDAPILLTTTNPAKTEKLRWVLEGLSFTCILLSQLPDPPKPQETGGSFEANAQLKALHGSKVFGGLAIASDGGLHIPALGDQWDELLTARAAGEGVDDAAHARHLLNLMQDKHGEERQVFWTEAVAVANRGQPLGSWEETGSEGYLTETYDPLNAIPGFWVYSLWYYPQFGKRYVELTPAELAQADLTWHRLRTRVLEFFQEKISS